MGSTKETMLREQPKLTSRSRVFGYAASELLVVNATSTGSLSMLSRRKTSFFSTI